MFVKEDLSSWQWVTQHFSAISLSHSQAKYKGTEVKIRAPVSWQSQILANALNKRGVLSEDIVFPMREHSNWLASTHWSALKTYTHK